MIPLRAAMIVASASLLTGGCVAAAIPAVAGGMIVRSERAKDKRKQPARQKPAEPVARSPVAGGQADGTPPVVVPTVLTELPAPGGAGAAGEDAATVLQAYQGLWSYLTAQAARRQRGEPLRSVVLDRGATLAAPRYVACGNKPLAVLFDIDENPAKSRDPDARWRRWYGDERDSLAAVPGVVEGVDAARRDGIAVVFMSGRSTEGAGGVIAALDRLGYGRFEMGKTLFLHADATADPARRAIAADHCVIAMVGDALEDFSSLLPTMGEEKMQAMAVTDTMVAPLWGAGWFLLPNAVRSTVVPLNNPSGEK